MRLPEAGAAHPTCTGDRNSSVPPCPHPRNVAGGSRIAPDHRSVRWRGVRISAAQVHGGPFLAVHCRTCRACDRFLPVAGMRVPVNVPVEVRLQAMAPRRTNRRRNPGTEDFATTHTSVLVMTPMADWAGKRARPRSESCVAHHGPVASVVPGFAGRSAPRRGNAAAPVCRTSVASSVRRAEGSRSPESPSGNRTTCPAARRDSRCLAFRESGS